ncbi:MAG: FprA family A-type flavoprotein, partial [Chloroflexi bacterium]|nr:FprA family A-type flavoprotein [Chloroflexota bacterium]
GRYAGIGIALIDTVDPSKEHELVSNLKKLGVEAIDYVISNHAEQDHSGSIPKILELYPAAKVVANSKCKGLLIELLAVAEERFMEVGDGDSLSLGGRTLEFIHAPWVHWPETMFTYLREDRVLFTCDFLGAHFATSELFSTDSASLYVAAKRYYAEILMPFRTSVKKHLERAADLEPSIIAPSHGPLYDNPEGIIAPYREWSSDLVKNQVVLPFVTMHGSTEKMVGYFADALIRRGIEVKPFNLTRVDLGELAMALVDAATLVLASPTVLSGAHPLAVNAAYLADALRPKLKVAGLIGSYGWGGRMVEQITELLVHVKVDFLEPVVAKGLPGADDYAALDRLAGAVAAKHRELGLLG